MGFFGRLVADLGDTVNLPLHADSEACVVAFEVDDRYLFSLELSQDRSRVVVVCEVEGRAVPPAEQEIFLRLNRLGATTDGIAYAMAPDTGDLQLISQLGVDGLTAVTVCDQFRIVIDRAMEWQRQQVPRPAPPADAHVLAA